MADSAQYTPDTVARHVKIAQQLLDQSKAPPIVHWAQGLNEMAQGALGGYMLNRAEGQEREGRADALKTALDALNGGGGGSTGAPASLPSAPSVPQDALSGTPMAGTSSPMSGGMLASADMSAPRGFRNNNPLNIEAGGFTQSQPGFQGSDGRFAQFGSMDQGVGAADALLQSYAKRGINTVGGIVNRWAPPSDNNPTNAYAASVAKALGADPNAPLDMTDPNVRKGLIGAMAQFENGKPLQMASVAGPMAFAPPSPQANPLSAPNDAGAPSPQPGGFDASAALPANVTAPAVRNVTGALNGTPQAPAQASPPAAQGGQTNRAAAIAAMLNPWTPPAMQAALAAQMNPEWKLMQQPDGTVMAVNPRDPRQSYVAFQGSVKPELKETGADPITGQKTFQEYDPKTHTMRPVMGPGGGPATPGQGGGMLAPGVETLDHSKTGDDYLNQFGPEVQAAVKAYMAGDVMPTGNPRKDQIATYAKTVAQKYGQDMGIPVSDATYSQKRTYRTQLGSNTPNSAGGQAKAFNQGIEHMSALADTLEKLDNSNGLGIPIVAEGVNKIRQGISTDQSAIADKAQGIGQTLAGEVGKLFSGSAGGGVHERELTRDRFSTIKSKPQLAAALEATLETMRGGLTALEQRRDEVMGPNSGIRFVNPQTEQKMAQIEATIARLKGQSAPKAAAEAPAGLPDGWSVQVR